MVTMVPCLHIFCSPGPGEQLLYTALVRPSSEYLGAPSIPDLVTVEGTK